MKPLVFLDTETTSKQDGRLVQLCVSGPAPDELWNRRFKPPVPIDFEAMAVHHITEKMVADLESFAASPYRGQVVEIIENNVVVAHNAPFDIEVLRREGVQVGEWICTLKVARCLWPDWPCHQLQYIRYRLGLEIDAGAAHDAKADVAVLQAVFSEMRRIMDDTRRTDEAVDVIETMLRWSREPSLLYAVTFGKYRGKTWEEVARADIQYLYWLKKQDCEEDLRHTVDHWINRFSKA